MTDLFITQLVKQPGVYRINVLNCGDLVLDWSDLINPTCPVNPTHLFPVIIAHFRVKVTSTSNQSQLIQNIQTFVQQALDKFAKNPKLHATNQATYTVDYIHSNYAVFFKLPYYPDLIRFNQLTYRLDWSNLLFWAIINRHDSNLIRELAKYISPKTFIAPRLTPLHLAVIYQEFEIVQTLVDLFPESHRKQLINQLTPEGTSALHYAVRYNSPKIVEYLLNEGANVDQRDDFGGKTPLVYAIMNSNLPLIQMLIIYGADPFLEFEVEIDDNFTSYNYLDLVTEVYSNVISHKNKERIKKLLNSQRDIPSDSE